MLSTDVESYLREYYYIRSLYGSVLEFCRESTDYILREELQEFIEFFTRLIPIATILTVSLKSSYSWIVSISSLLSHPRLTQLFLLPFVRKVIYHYQQFGFIYRNEAIHLTHIFLQRVYQTMCELSLIVSLLQWGTFRNGMCLTRQLVHNRNGLHDLFSSIDLLHFEK